MADVFLSYARNDEALAERLARALEAVGLSVWFDRKLRGGAEFSSVIEREISAARHVVVLWTEHGVASHWVRDEASMARDQGKMVPVSFGGVLPPMGFRQFQAVNLTGWQKHPRGRLPTGFLEVLGKGREIPAFFPEASSAGRVSRSRGRLAAMVAAALLIVAGVVWGGLAWWSPVARPETVRLVVMPLKAGGTSRAEVALADGITEELIDRLRRIPGLAIVTGAEGKASTDAPVLHGSVRQDGGQLRVASRLEAPDGQVLWTDNFDRDMTDLFDVQEAIARSVSGALSVSLDVGIESKSYGGTDSPEAYAAYVQGRALRWDNDRSIPRSYLERAIKLDPGYAKALAELAIYNGLSIYSARNEEDVEVLLHGMDSYSAQALKQAPRAWVGFAARGWYYLVRQDFAAAEKQFAAALARDPGNDPELLDNVAFGYSQLGKRTKTSELRRAKAQIDPYFRDEYLVSQLFWEGRYDEAIKAAARDPDLPQGSAALFTPHFALLMAGRLEEARQEGIRRGYVPPVPALSDDLPDLPYAALEKWADGKFGRMGGRTELALNAVFAGYLGHDRLALDYLRLAYDRPGMGYYFLIWHPALARVRQTPEFARFVTDLGMDKGWRASGDWGDFCKPAAGNGVTCA